jgi:hypothetical protein
VYSKEQSSKLKQAFWTAFGQYIAPHPSVDGVKINWINYKTGIKHLYFKMLADNHSAKISIELVNPDPVLQKILFNHFELYKNVLALNLEEDWDWQLYTEDENGKIVSRISKTQYNVSVYNQQDWPLVISFLKPRIIALDAFWNDAQYGFEVFK